MPRSQLFAVATLLALALGGAARAIPPSQDNGPAVDLPLDRDVTSATLAQAPTNDDLATAYPRIPLLMGMSGSASMTCKALASGRLEDCHVVSEEPAGLGFGAATVRTAPYFQVHPATRDGRAVDGSITIPMRWQPDGLRSTPEPLVLVPATPTALALSRRIAELQNFASQYQASWEPSLEQETARLMAGSDARTGQALVEAFRQGLNDAIQAELDRQVHELAANESETDLKATVAFLESPSGRAWTAATAQASASAPKDFYDRIAAAARTHFCPEGVCTAKSSISAGR